MTMTITRTPDQRRAERKRRTRRRKQLISAMATTEQLTHAEADIIRRAGLDPDNPWGWYPDEEDS